jgi:DNA-binding beta-propeller fold protein YncE
MGKWRSSPAWGALAAASGDGRGLMSLQIRQTIDVPPYKPGSFDHADVHPASGRVFVAHTAFGQVEILDGEASRHVRTVLDCPEASGVLYAPEVDWIFAAARGTGTILVLTSAGDPVRTLAVGARPNGLAWDSEHRHLLVADVQDNTARIVDPADGRVVATAQLGERPRWCIYDRVGEQFWVNIREPAAVVALAAVTGVVAATLPVDAAGPHGLALDEAADRLYVACDSGDVVVLEHATGATLARVAIAGEPDVIWLNRQRKRLYVAIGKPGLLQVVDLERLHIVEEVQSDEGAKTFTFDEQRQRLYLFLPQRCQALVYDEVS